MPKYKSQNAFLHADIKAVKVWKILNMTSLALVSIDSLAYAFNNALVHNSMTDGLAFTILFIAAGINLYNTLGAIDVIKVNEEMLE